MSRPAYDRDPFLTRLDTAVVATETHQGRPWVRLADTLFYPEGGGQPSDRGWIQGIPVLEVQKDAEGIRHRLEAPVPEGPVCLTLDWARRFDHMQQHTGQHLLTAVAQDRFGWATTAFHLGAQVSDIEVDGAVGGEALAELEAAVAQAIREARPVTARWVTAEAYGAEAVRSRGLPAGHTGEVRLVGIEGLDLNTCGGTHLAHTGQLESLCLLGTEPLRGGTRIFYVAGGRVRSRMRRHEGRNLALRTLLGAPDEDLVATLEGKLGQAAAAERRIRHLEEALAVQLATGLAGSPEPRPDLHLEGEDAAFLAQVGRLFASLAPAKAALLTARREGQAAFVLAAGADSGVDLQALGRAVAECLEGRGGGRAPVFQGKAGSLAARDEALARLRQA